MVLQVRHNDGRQAVKATLAEAGGQREYACLVTACGNPTCTCGVAYVNLFAIEHGDVANPAKPDHIVCIDVLKKKLVVDQHGPMTTKERLFGKAFFDALDADDLELLWKLQGTFKIIETEKAPVEKFNIAFDFNAVEVDGLLYAYNDVLPYGARLRTYIDTRNYLLFDHYCLRPKCQCTRINLAILNEPDPVTVPLEKVDELCSVTLDYKSRKWTIQKHSCHQSLVREIRTDAETNFDGDFYLALAKRHKRLQDIYQHSRRQCPGNGASHRSPDSAVPRNAPCPCGSGKKFKKCCGR